jgi:DNA-binding response OmpR family regulator
MQKNILLIEDNESYSEILQKKLLQEEFEVAVASDGHEGVSKTKELRPDIVLIDLLLPKMNGVQVMNEIRMSEEGKNIPLMILTNLNPDAELLKNIEKNRPAFYLVKPEVSLEDIVEKIKNTLQASL